MSHKQDDAVAVAFSTGRHHPAAAAAAATSTLAFCPSPKYSNLHYRRRSPPLPPSPSTSYTAAATPITTSTTTLLRMRKPLSSLLTSIRKRREETKLREFEKRQRIREEIEELEDEDFLLADVKPKALVHERDFFRQATRIQAWDEYVLVSILSTSISYNALQSFQLNTEHQGIFLYESVLLTAIQIVAGLSSLSGLYATMVFSLSILYGRTSLGLERDPQYDNFLEHTQQVRITAFKAFSLSLACFAVLVVLVLAENLPLVMHLPVGGLLLGILFVGYRDWKVLVDNATDIFDYLED